MVRVGRRPAGDNADGSVAGTDNIQPGQLQGGNAGGRTRSRRAAPDAGGETAGRWQRGWRWRDVPAGTGADAGPAGR